MMNKRNQIAVTFWKVRKTRKQSTIMVFRQGVCDTRTLLNDKSKLFNPGISTTNAHS